MYNRGMSNSKYLQDPVFLDGVKRLKEGKINRAGLATEWGISVATLSKRFGYAGLLEELRGTKESGKGDNGSKFTADPDNVNRFDQALAELKAAPNTSIRKVHQRHPHLHYATLCQRAKAAGIRT